MKKMGIIIILMLAGGLFARSHFNFHSGSQDHHFIAIGNAVYPNGNGLAENDEIGVFTQDGLCVGATLWGGANTVLTAWEDDLLTPDVIDGYEIDDTMSFKIWNAGIEVEYETEVTFVEGEGVFGEFITNVILAAVNHLPILEPIGDQAMNEDASLDLTLFATDIDGDVLTFAAESDNPDDVFAMIDADTLRLSATENYNDTANITVTVNDGNGGSDSEIFVLTIESVNDAPTADAQEVSTDEDVAVEITLTGFDVDGDDLAFSVVDSPTNGVLSGTAPNVIYTPNENYNGGDSFTFLVNDGTEDSNIATVNITIIAVNDAPTIVFPDSFTFAEDGS